MGGGQGGKFGNTQGNILDIISNLLATASLIPGVDTFTDLASIPIDLLRGDFLSAGLDAFGVIPFIGEVADTAKLAKIADKAIDTTKIANKSTNAIKAISPSALTSTHKLTLSKKQYNNLVNDIRKNGITESIKYVEHNGRKYVVDGHHRLHAAKQLKLDKIPVEKVSLPYKGYKTTNDLLWYE